MEKLSSAKVGDFVIHRGGVFFVTWKRRKPHFDVDGVSTTALRMLCLVATDDGYFLPGECLRPSKFSLAEQLVEVFRSEPT